MTNRSIARRTSNKTQTRRFGRFEKQLRRSRDPSADQPHEGFRRLPRPSPYTLRNVIQLHSVNTPSTVATPLSDLPRCAARFFWSLWTRRLPPQSGPSPGASLRQSPPASRCRRRTRTCGSPSVWSGEQDEDDLKATSRRNFHGCVFTFLRVPSPFSPPCCRARPCTSPLWQSARGYLAGCPPGKNDKKTNQFTRCNKQNKCKDDENRGTVKDSSTRQHAFKCFAALPSLSFTDATSSLWNVAVTWMITLRRTTLVVSTSSSELSEDRKPSSSAISCETAWVNVSGFHPVTATNTHVQLLAVPSFPWNLTLKLSEKLCLGMWKNGPPPPPPDYAEVKWNGKKAQLSQKKCWGKKTMQIEGPMCKTWIKLS